MTRLLTKARQALYDCEVVKARAADAGDFPVCNLCGNSVLPGQKWDKSHARHRPKALGGTEIGIAHLRCNRIHGSKVVTPLMAKLRRIRSKYLDLHAAQTPLPGGRHDTIMRKMDGETVYRNSGKPIFSKPWVKEIG